MEIQRTINVSVPKKLLSNQQEPPCQLSYIAISKYLFEFSAAGIIGTLALNEERLHKVT